MDIDISDEQRMLQATTRRFLEDEDPMSSIRSHADGGRAFSVDYWKRAAQLGWTSMLMPESEEAPSNPKAILDLAIVAEEAGRALEGGPLIACNVVVDALVKEASAGKRDEILRGIADGTTIATWAFAEGAEGWSVSDISLRAELDGDSYVLRGTKSSGEAADVADVFLVTVKIGDEIAQLLIPRETSGVEVMSLPTLDISRTYGDVIFDGARIPTSARIGGPGGTEAQVENQLLLALTLQCAEMVGTLDKVFSWTLDYMQDRYAFGRPIGSYQALKHRVADHKVWLEAGLGLSSGLTWAYANGDPDAMELACVAKSHIGDESIKIISDCAQMFGGIAITWEHDLHLYLRRATVDRTLYGSPPQLRERLCRLLGV
jgi:alkylation response protein AidB-like acyl-CoA dehydrogenase